MVLFLRRGRNFEVFRRKCAGKRKPSLGARREYQADVLVTGEHRCPVHEEKEIF
jgi:hypothetical protein